MIKIVKAKPEESNEIRDFEDTLWEEKHVTSRYDMVSFVTFGYVFLAKDEGKIIGAIIAMKTKNDEIRVTDWIVDEKYRRLGIGTKLYKKLFKETDGLNVITYIKTDNIPSLESHKKLGFKKVKKVRDPYLSGKEKYYWLVKR